MKELLQKIFRFFYPHKDPAMLKREYGIPDTITLNIKLAQDGWFVITSPDLPGLTTQARNYQELIEMVNDAVLSYFDVPKREADIVYDKFNIGDQVIQYSGQLQTRTT